MQKHGFMRMFPSIHRLLHCNQRHNQMMVSCKFFVNVCCVDVYVYIYIWVCTAIHSLSCRYSFHDLNLGGLFHELNKNEYQAIRCCCLRFYTSFFFFVLFKSPSKTGESGRAAIDQGFNAGGRMIMSVPRPRALRQGARLHPGGVG